MSEGERNPDRDEAIRNRAYAIWFDEGQAGGRDIEHWLEAEKEIDREASSGAQKQVSKSKHEEEKQLTKELEMSFPASDPPASTQPGAGITGPEVVKMRKTA
jgi:hypothetical protein